MMENKLLAKIFFQRYRTSLGDPAFLIMLGMHRPRRAYCCRESEDLGVGARWGCYIHLAIDLLYSDDHYWGPMGLGMLRPTTMGMTSWGPMGVGMLHPPAMGST